MANVTKRGKSYRIKVSCGYDTKGVQIIKSRTWTPDEGLTEKQITKELKRQSVLFEEDCKNGQFLNSSIKFSEFTDIWLKDYAEKNLKSKTVARYKILLTRINKAIGHIKLSKLQPLHLMRFYENLGEEGVREDICYIPKEDITMLWKKSGSTKTDLASNHNFSVATFNQACKGLKIRLTSAEAIAASLGYKLNDLFSPDTSKTTLSQQTIQHHHRLISTILQTAVEWQVIPSNPCSRVKTPSVKKKESRFLEDYQVADLFKALENEPLQYETIITLFVYTGMRRGELCGLKWSDIDFNKCLINIQREILYLPEIGIFEDTTKTDQSKRIIKVADICFKLLKKHKVEQNKERIKVGDQWENGDFIFTQWNGRPIHPDTLTAWFPKFLKKHDLPNVTIHSLRHTNASLMIMNGVNVTTVAKRLGHSNASTTTRIYAHAIQSADEQAADILQDLLNKKPN